MARAEAKQLFGVQLARAKWARAIEGSRVVPEVRRRLVVQEFASAEPRDDLFVGAPPLTALRVLLSGVVSQKNPGQHIVMVLDVKSAFLYSRARQNICVEVPPADHM
eukprot:6882972-Lingulodinium_polyedra.AAC.1